MAVALGFCVAEDAFELEAIAVGVGMYPILVAVSHAFTFGIIDLEDEACNIPHSIDKSFGTYSDNSSNVSLTMSRIS